MGRGAGRAAGCGERTETQLWLLGFATLRIADVTEGKSASVTAKVMNTEDASFHIARVTTIVRGTSSSRVGPSSRGSADSKRA